MVRVADLLTHVAALCIRSSCFFLFGGKLSEKVIVFECNSGDNNVSQIQCEGNKKTLN